MTTHRPFTTIIFDLDGTLLDTAPDVHYCSNQVLVMMGLAEISLERARASIGHGPDNFARMTLGEENVHRFGEFISRFRELYGMHCLVRTRPFPGVVELLAKLRGHRLAIATNKPRPYTRRMLDGLDLGHYFHAIICPEQVRHLKPHPEMILTAIERTGGSLQSTVVVGDTDNDILAARAAGVAACAVTWGYGPRATLEALHPDFLISSPKELLAVLNGHIQEGRDPG